MSGIEELADLVRDHAEATEPDTVGAVSVGFFWVRKTKELDVETFIKAIDDAHLGYYSEVTIERLCMGPSYIELGGWLGDQGLALTFIGLGELVGLWTVITPAILGIIEEAPAQQMLGSGLVMPGVKSDSPLRSWARSHD